MPHLYVDHANISLIIQRTGDLDPYTCSIGAKMSSSGFSGPDADTLGHAMASAAAPTLTSMDTVKEVHFAYDTGLGIQQWITPTAVAGTQGSATSQAPQNCAILIQKRTGTAGKKGRGRMYWPGVLEGDVDGVGQVIAVAITRLQTMLTAWQAAMTASLTFDDFAVLHTDTTTVPYIITSFSVSPLLATQRRRLRR